ncbi:hypothetical protein VHEMI01755 [[Torrubiella] hemipterigena]|uniref:Cyanovirin-N domain-containing protein n=1 Tax=[Torrubiella] hemipterigena TaxID=1531966 RepID=A0A0A1T6C4_9HYPO|nr:hypothetical protein VHEMI01755 [[Torrubiella] hemipterigena]
MKSFAVAITALASIAAARFSGTLDILMVDQNNCLYASIDPRDTQLMVGCDTTKQCQANGNEIATTHFKCQTGKGDADIFTYPHDVLKFCRAGFCSCMSTRYSGKSNNGIDTLTKVHFEYDDDHAWAC